MTRNEFDKKYAELILNNCIVKDGRRLLIQLDNIDTFSFAKLLYIEALKRNISDVDIVVKDENILHSYYETTQLEKIKQNNLLDYSIQNEYAKRKDNILIITSPIPGLMDDIDPEKIIKGNNIKNASRPYYREHVVKYSFPWSLVAYPNKEWANMMYPNDKNSLGKLFFKIMQSLMLDSANPAMEWQKKKEELNKYKNILNEIKINSLHIENELGTNLTFSLPENYKFLNFDKSEVSPFAIMNNLPSYELFTGPVFNSAEGMVYSSKPLVLNNNIVDNFCFKFKNGKVCDYDAKIGKKLLDEFFLNNTGVHYLGEIGLVEHASPISNTNTVFYEGLFDENAATHLALGKSYAPTIKDGELMTDEELLEHGLNVSNQHVDFMIGTSDTTITAYTDKGLKRIMTKGNFCI